jgi:ribosome-associated protein
MEEKIEKTTVDSKALARALTAALIEKKAGDVRMFYVEGESSITDYYVNATGRSSTQVMALADEVMEKAEALGRSGKIEGRDGRAWLLVDFGDVIVNVFDKPSREFYNFDRHLPEGTEIDVSDIIEEIDKKFEINTAEEN